MGQAESSPKSDYLLDDKQEKLIQQYTGVEIGSFHSENNLRNKTHEIKKEKYDIPKINGEPESKYQTDNDKEFINNAATFVSCVSDKLIENTPNTERKDSSDFSSTNPSRKISRDFEFLKEHHSSSEKIFEEYAEYANDLLNAPYNLTTKYTSLETVSSKNNQDIISGLEYDVNESTGTVDAVGNKTVTSENNSVNTPITNKLFNATYTDVSVSHISDSEKDKAFKGDKKTDNSKVNLIKEKFEKKYSSSADTSVKHSEKCLSKQKNEGSKTQDNDLKVSSIDKLHKPLSRKNAVIVDIGGDLTTNHNHTHSEYDSAYINSHMSINSKLQTTSTHDQTFEELTFSPSYKFDNNSPEVNLGVPNVSTIKTVIDSEALTRNIKEDDKRVSNNGFVVFNGKPNIEKILSESVVNHKSTIDIPENKPNVALLRRKFENVIQLENNTSNANNETSDNLSNCTKHWIPIKDDLDFEIKKYPIAKSKSDGQIRFSAKNKTQAKGNFNITDSDGLYEEYTICTSYSKKDSNSTKSAVNSPVIEKYLRKAENKVRLNEDYYISLNNHQKQDKQLKSDLSNSPKTRNKVLRNRSCTDSCSIQPDSFIEVLYDDCIVVEPQKDHHKEKAAKHLEKKDTGKVHIEKNMDFRRTKKESKRHRRKSDSSTSNLSDSSTPVTKSSKKWKKSKENKEKPKTNHLKSDDNEDTGLSQQWGSMITEYQEKYVSNDTDKKKRFGNNNRRSNKLSNMEQYNNVKQVFNRGMVLPIKRAPPGMSAQEIESDSGVTDYSTHSWTAVHHPIGIRAHTDGAAYTSQDGETYIKQRLDDPLSSPVGVHHEARIHPARTRFSSQSSQYTSDVTLSPGRQRKIFNDINNHVQKHNNIGYTDGHRGISRHSSSYSDRPLTPEAYHHSRLTRHYSDYPSSPEGPRRMRLVKQTISHSSDGAMSPTIVKKIRGKSLPREPYIEASEGKHLRERSMSRDRLDYGTGGRYYEYSNSLGRPHVDHHVVEYASNSNSLGRPQPQHQFHARSLSRDRLNRKGVQRNIQQRSMSSDRLDYVRSASPSIERRLKERSYSHDNLEPADHEMMHYEYMKKRSKKKTIDEKAKSFVDNVIDEAIDRFTLSPKSKRKSKSKDNLSSKTNRKNIVNTTNIYNEYIEDDSNMLDEERILDRKAYSDFEDNRMHDERQGYDNFENSLRRWNSNQRLKPSLLRPQPIDNSLKFERRACIRPIAGTGVTRDGNVPPPKSAYKNYDFELSVGPFQYSGEEKQKKERRMQNHYSSESEYSAAVDNRGRHHTSSQYPHISFGPTKAKSEENLLSENKQSYSITPQKHSVLVKKKRVNHKNIFVDKGGFESEPEDKNKYNPPTLTRGMVTKIMHKLDKDVNRLSIKGKSKKRQPLNLEMAGHSHDYEYVTNTWPRNENDFIIPDMEVSQVGTALYGTLPNNSTNSFYVQSNHKEMGPVSTSSPVQVTNNIEPNRASRNINQQESMSAVPSHSRLNVASPHTQPIILYEEQKDQREMSNLGHARFKMYHGEQNKMQQNKENQSLSMQMSNETSNTGIPKMTIDERDARYGAFSNEQMIVADLIENQKIKMPLGESKNDMYEVRKVGHLFSTKPDVSMNKQQTLNFYLFNQSKSVDETDKATLPRISYMARNVEYSNNGQKQQQQTDLFINEDMLDDSDTELREYLIHHKQTQTPSISKVQKPKRKENKQYIPVYRSPLPQRKSRKHVETTHYITQEREIEKVPQQKQMKEMCIQTDKEEHAQVQYIQQPEYTVGRVSPKQQESIQQNFVAQSSFFNRPVITESRHMEKHNYELPSEDSSPEPTPPPSPPVPQKNIPVMIQPSWNDEYTERIEHEYQQQHNIVPVQIQPANMEVAVKSDDEETVILETTEIEEREQRIAMAIFEEIEFSATRTEGGKTVRIDGESEIPNFWEPGKFEAVVDRKKKKMTQVKDTKQEQGGKRTKQPTNHLAIEDGQHSNDGTFFQEKKPISIEEQKSINKQNKNEISDEVTEKIAALDKVLEDELAKDEQAVEEPEVVKRNVKSNTKINQGGESVTENYVNYEKIIDMADGNNPQIPNPPKYGDVFRSSRTLTRSPQTQRCNVTTSYRPESKVYSSDAWKYSYDPPQQSPTLTQKIKKIKSSYQHTPLEPLFMTERGEMYGRTGKISHHPGMPVQSEIDPNNISFVKMTNHELKESEEFNMQPETVPEKSMAAPPTPPPPPVGVLNGQTIHSEQSQPLQQVHYEKDKDGNLIKVTEWQHKLTKTVEYPEEDDVKGNLSLKKQTKKSINELPEAGYIKMNLHETVSSSGKASENETETNEGSESVYNVNSTGPEVVEETEVGVKPFHFESKQNTLMVEDDLEMSKERQFLYDIKKAKLKPVPKAYKNGWGRKFTYGTMSTHL